MKRQELISSKEYWSTTIALRLWTYNGSRDDDFDTYEKMAESIVDDDFIKAMEEYRSQLPESKELLGDDDAGVIAVNVASNVIPKLTTQEEAFFIAGFQECVKYLRTSPLLASKDARIRELEEANKLAEIKIAELIELNLTPTKN